MKTPPMTSSRDPREVLRGAVTRVEDQLSLVDCPPALRDAWVDLVETLALGRPPELRDCPACGEVVMRAAIRCGYCWIALDPMVDTPGSSH